MATIRSLTHPRVKRLYKVCRDKKSREAEGICVIYSATILQEITGKTVLQELWVPRGQPIPRGLKSDVVVETTPEVIQKIAGLRTTCDVVGVVALPSESPQLLGRRLLLLDRICDPGNLGTLVRTALAFGWEGVYMTRGCVDPFNDKALRASRGALFSLPFQIGEARVALNRYPHHRLLVADPKGKALLPVEGHLLLALGNEAEGPSAPLREQGESIAIPIAPEMESLNVAVAGGILMYTLGSYGK